MRGGREMCERCVRGRERGEGGDDVRGGKGVWGGG